MRCCYSPASLFLTRKSEIEYYAMLAKTGVHHYSGNNIELGTACGKYYRVCTLAIIDPGECLLSIEHLKQCICLFPNFSYFEKAGALLVQWNGFIGYRNFCLKLLELRATFGFFKSKILPLFLRTFAAVGPAQSGLIQDYWFARKMPHGALCWTSSVFWPVLECSSCPNVYSCIYRTLSSTGWLLILSPSRWFWHHQEHARSAAATSVELFPCRIVINKISVKGKCCCLLISDYALVCSSCMCPPGSTNTLLDFSYEDSPR